MTAYILKKVRTAKDVSSLYRLVAHTPIADLPPRIPLAYSIRDFETRMSDALRFEIHDLYCVNDQQGATVGFIYSYDYRTNDGNCKIAFSFPPALCSEDAQDMIIEFCNYMFRQYSLIKLLTEACSLDKRNITLCQEAGFSLECCLREYIYKNGNYVDWNIYGKERFDE